MHEEEKGVLQIISLLQPGRQAEDDAQLFHFFIRELLWRLVEQSLVVLAKSSPLSRKMFLYLLPYAFQRPDHLSGNMVTVNHDDGLGEASLRDLTEMRVHIHDEILDLFPVFKLTKITNEIRLFAIWENIQDLSVFRVSQNRLVFLAIGISLEFINGEDFRQLLAGIVDKIKITESCTD